MSETAILLKVLLKQRHLQSHKAFCKEYDKIAAKIDPELKGTFPSRAQFFRWLSGNIVGLPYPHHCRILAQMFPEWATEELFQPYTGGLDFVPQAHRTTVRSADNLAHPAASSQPVNAPAELAAFLGADIMANGVTLVYPTFELAPASVDALQTAGIPRQHYYQKTNSAFTIEHRIDVPVAVAENDVRALLYVSSMLQRHTSSQSSIENDREVVAKCDRAYISFGLSSNDCTHMYLQRTSTPLFTIKNDPESTSFLEYIETADGVAFRSTDATNIGIIVRTRPDRVLHPTRQWFYCAGLGPRGTSGASWYFANNWRALYDQVGDSDFVAVLKVQAYSDQTAQLTHIYMDRPSSTEEGKSA